MPRTAMDFVRDMKACGRNSRQIRAVALSTRWGQDREQLDMAIKKVRKECRSK